MPITPEQILQALSAVQDPDLHRDIVTLGFVKDIEIDNGKVSFAVELTTPACPVKDLLQQQAHDVVAALDNVSEVVVTMTARVRASAEPKNLIPNVRQVVAIASGKGGVGKSTVSVNLAVALAQQGAKVGLLDADVYGPTVPLMMGCSEARPYSQDGKIVPIEKFGISMMSLGFLLEEGQAVLWRGPMVAATLKQLLEDVLWGELDYLLVDLPPGTGDAPMSLAQLASPSGIVLVTTPHSVAANIAAKSTQLFSRMGVPLLGVVENMASFACPSCGEVTEIFAGTPGADLAKSLESEFLGSIPLDPIVSKSGEQGIPSIVLAPERPQAGEFIRIAQKLAAQLSILSEKSRENPADLPVGAS